MTDRSSYPAGTFSWAELATSDGEAAKPFYTAVFGWTYDDRPVGPDMVYSMAQLEGRSAAALFTSDQPPHWNCYVTVDDVDAAAITSNGSATIVAPSSPARRCACGRRGRTPARASSTSRAR